jgi:hypothetical protein
MTFKRRKTDRGAGRADGGETATPLVPRAAVDAFDEEDSTSYEVYANLLEDEDDNPVDRRRDPLRRL